MSARSRRRQSRARASFGPEWRPLTGMALAVLDAAPTRRARERSAAVLRGRRRAYAALIGRQRDYVLAGSAR